jgi:hypothetical protein
LFEELAVAAARAAFCIARTAASAFVVRARRSCALVTIVVTGVDVAVEEDDVELVDDELEALCRRMSPP